MNSEEIMSLLHNSLQCSTNDCESKLLSATLKDNKMRTITAVECQKCGKLHKTDSDETVIVAGNITRGNGAGIIENNLDNDDQVITKTVYCIDCFLQYLNETLKGTIYR